MVRRVLLGLAFVLAAFAIAQTWTARAESNDPGLALVAGRSYQVENVGSPGQSLRPRDADNRDGTPLVLYPKTSWRCMTWRVDAVTPAATTQPSELVVHLYNHFTHKTLMPDPAATGDARSVIERGLTSDLADAELWRFVPIANGLYRIEHVPTGMSLAASSEGNVVVGKYTGDASQQWRLLPKPEKFTG